MMYNCRGITGPSNPLYMARLVRRILKNVKTPVIKARCGEFLIADMPSDPSALAIKADGQRLNATQQRSFWQQLKATAAGRQGIEHHAIHARVVCAEDQYTLATTQNPPHSVYLKHLSWRVSQKPQANKALRLHVFLWPL